MSEHHEHGASTIRASKHSDDGGGGGGKWLLGALAAVVIAGGGYYAWQNYSPSQQQTDLETAYNDSYVDEPISAGPLGASDDSVSEDLDANDIAAEPAATPPPRRAAPAPRSTPASDEPAPEVTVGVTPISASTSEAALVDESDEVIVRGARRPIWTATPSQRRLSALYPVQALERGREGEARLQCTVLEGGALDCVRAEETSRTFGAAALRVARGFRHSTTLADGSDAVGTPVNVRVIFRIEEEEGRGSRYASR